MSPGFLRIAVVLGLISAVSPIAIDLYLPGLPMLAADLGATEAAAQATLTGYFAAFGLGQLFFGPWADASGRKLPLYVGLMIFLVASIGSYAAPTIEFLTAMRTLQGFGGAVCMVVTRAVIRDLYTGEKATRLLALVMLVIAVSPMVAPLMGSGIIALFDWRAVFAVLAIATVLSLILLRFALPETLAPERRIPFSWRTFAKGSARLLTNARFVGLTMVAGFGFSSFMLYLAGAPFVYERQFGLTPTQFSLLFSVNAIGFFVASQFAPGAAMRFGAGPVIAYSTLGFAFFGLLLFALTASLGAHLWLIVLLLFLANACMGLIIPSAMVGALDPHGDIAGLASSLGGTIQMVTGGIMVSIAAPFFDATALPMVTAIAIATVLALLVSLVGLGPTGARLASTAGS